MQPTSAVVGGFPRSGIRELIDLATATPGMVRLEVGEPDFVTAQHIIDAATADPSAGYTKYAPTSGFMALRRAIAARASRQWGRPVEPESVFVAAGGLGAATAALFSVADAHDRVLVPDPRWPNLMGLVAVGRLDPVGYVLRAENEFLPDLAELERQLAGGVKAVYINNPGNPTGAVFPRTLVQRIAELTAEHGAYLISDEVYDEMVYDGAHTPAALFDQGHVITIGSFSKTYAMTGWRVGYAIVDPAIVLLCEKVSEALSLMASSVSQRAAEAALSGPQDCVIEMRTAYRRRRDLVCGLLEGTDLLAAVPSGAFYALLDLRALGVPSHSLALELANREYVSTAPGSTFGETCEGMLRISLASAESDLRVGCERIVAFARRHLH